MMAVSMTLMMLVFAVLMVLVYAYSVLGDIEVEIERVRIVETGNRSLLLDVDIVVSNPSIFSADTRRADLTLHHWGRKVASFEVPALHVGPGDNDVSMTIVLREEDGPGLFALARETFTGEGTAARVRGKVSTEGPFSFEMDLDRRFELGRGETIRTRLDTVDIGYRERDLVGVDINATIVNTGMIESTLEGLSFDIVHNGSVLFSHFTEGLLLQGDNPMAISFAIGPDDVERFRPLVAGMAGGATPTVDIVGIDRNSTLLSRLSTAYRGVYGEEESDLNGLADANITVLNADVTTDESGISVDADIEIDNPTPVAMTLDGLDFELGYNGSAVTTVSTNGTLQRGRTVLHFDIRVPAERVWIVNEMAAATLNGTPMTLEVAGIDVNGRALSRLSTEFAREVDLSDEGGVDMAIADIDIDLGILTTEIGIGATVDNSLPVTVNLTGFEFRAYHNGGQIGNVHLQDPVIVPGPQTVNATLDIGILTLLTRIDLILGFLSGAAMEITMVASRTFNDGHALVASTTVVYGG